MPRPAWVIAAQLEARQAREAAVAELFAPGVSAVVRLGTVWLTVPDLAVLLLDMGEEDWRVLLHMRRIEEVIRRNAAISAERGARKAGERRGRKAALDRAALSIVEGGGHPGGTPEWTNALQPPQRAGEGGDGHGS